MSKSAFSTRRIALCAILIALYFAVSLFSIELSGVKITFDSLPVTVGAMLFGPIDGFLIGLLGELLSQIVRYGLTVTTALWIVPPALRGLMIGLGCVVLKKQMRIPSLSERKVPIVYFAVCIIAAAVTSLGNTAAYYFDSKIFGYYQFALIFGVAGIRLLTNILSSVLTAAAAIPVLLGLRKAGAVSTEK